MGKHAISAATAKLQPNEIVDKLVDYLLATLDNKQGVLLVAKLSAAILHRQGCHSKRNPANLPSNVYVESLSLIENAEKGRNTDTGHPVADKLPRIVVNQGQAIQYATQMLVISQDIRAKGPIEITGQPQGTLSIIRHWGRED